MGGWVGAPAACPSAPTLPPWQGCPRLRRLALRHTGAVTDMGARAVANRCKGLRDLVLEHTAVGDAGVLALAKGLPALRSLSLANYTRWADGQVAEAGKKGRPAGGRCLDGRRVESS